MASLKDMCDMVDDLIADGTSPRIDGSDSFWKRLSKDPAAVQLYTECLIYKYIALWYGLGNRPLFQTISQIKNISAPNGQKGKADVASASGSSSPRGSFSSSGKTKRGSDNLEIQTPEAKSTPKRKFYIRRRKSEDTKKLKKDLSVDSSDSRRKSKRSPSSEFQENQDEKENQQAQIALENILLSLTYISKMCDLTKWDFTKLREVFLIWNKVRGWEQTASDYESAVMKRFSMSPAANTYDEEQLQKYVNEILASVNKVPDEPSVMDNRAVGESINYWEIRHKILTRPEDAISVIKCLSLVAKKLLDDGDESKILPLLHILCETIIMSPHTPLELLQECYSTFEMFYVWPNYIAHPVKEVLDMIQLEMKCPGHFYRMIFCQDNDMPLAPYLSARMPCSETHVFIDDDVPDSEAMNEAFKKLRETRASTSKLTAESGMHRFVLKHIFESVFGSGCCDLSMLEQALQNIPKDLVQDMCYEALSLMEQASMKDTHTEAQEFLRVELEIFSDKLVDFLETEDERENELEDKHSSSAELSKPKQGNFRRVSVLYETCRTRDPGSPMRASFSAGQIGTPSPRRNNSYLRRNTSGSLDNPLGARKLASKEDALAKGTLAELLGAKVSTSIFSHADLSDSLFELVRNTAKEYVKEKKRSARLSFSRKRDCSDVEDQDAYRDSGVIDDEDTNGDTKFLTTAVQHLSIDEKYEEDTSPNEVKLREKSSKGQLSSNSSSNDDDSDSCKLESDTFWKEFMERGFDSQNEDIVELMKTMTFDQRKSFLIESKKRQQSTSSESYVVDIPISTSASPTIMVQNTTEAKESISLKVEVVKPESTIESEEVQAQCVQGAHRRLTRTDNKRASRLSRLVRSKKRSTKKGKSDGDSDKLLSRESLSSASSAPSSTTSEELNDTTQSARIRTTSDPLLRRKRTKWASATVASLPLVGNHKRDRLSVDVMPQSPFSLSVRSLPSRERASLFGNGVFGETRQVSPLAEDKSAISCEGCETTRENTLHLESSTSEQECVDCCFKRSRITSETLRNPLQASKSVLANLSYNDHLVKSIPTFSSKAKFLLGIDDEDEVRQRIDSGIGHENGQDSIRRRTASYYTSMKEQEDHGIGGVKFALKEVMRESRRHRMSVSDSLTEKRTVYKKVLKLVFIGNDKTVGHVARAYYNLRKRQMSRAPLFQHVDLRLFFIPLSSVNLKEKDDVVCGQHSTLCDIRVGELMGTFDSWYHTVVTLSVNNLLHVYPKICAGDEPKADSEEALTEKQPPKKLLAPQEVIASALLSYCRFAVSRNDVNMYKVAMKSSTGEVFTDVFCCQLKIGHDAYTTAVKAGRFGKLGKLVDLNNDSGPPPAYIKIEYSKWSIDGQLIYTGQLGEAFYHTVCVTPLSLCKNYFRGTDILRLVLIDNEKKQKASRRTSGTKLSAMEEAEIAGGVLDIGTMKMEVVRPMQGTFCLVLDNSTIYTSIKSIEIVPCAAPETDIQQNPGKVASRHLREHQLIRLPFRTFWPGTQ